MQVNVFINQRKKPYERKNTKHHIIARSHSYLFKTDHPDNIVQLDDKHHKAFHTFFQGALTPQEQLNVLYNMYAPVVSTRVLRLLDELLDMEEQNFYRPELLKNKKR